MRTFVLAALVSLALAPAAPARTSASATDALTKRINVLRAKHDLRPLKPAPRLMRSARGYARRMMRTNTFGHGGAYRSAGFRTAGEILFYASGWRLSPRLPLRQWRHSTGHRSVMLSGRFRYIGASPARGRHGGRPATMWVVHFGAH